MSNLILKTFFYIDPTYKKGEEKSLLFIIAIVLSIIGLVFLGMQPLYKLGVFGSIWTIFIFLVTLLSILLIARNKEIENYKLFWKKKNAMKRRIIILDILKISIGITYVLGLFGMLLQGIFPMYISLLINGFIFAPIGLLLLGNSIESERQEKC